MAFDRCVVMECGVRVGLGEVESTAAQQDREHGSAVIAPLPKVSWASPGLAARGLPEAQAPERPERPEPPMHDPMPFEPWLTNCKTVCCSNPPSAATKAQSDCGTVESASFAQYPSQKQLLGPDLWPVAASLVDGGESWKAQDLETPTFDTIPSLAYHQAQRPSQGTNTNYSEVPLKQSRHSQTSDGHPEFGSEAGWRKGSEESPVQVNIHNTPASAVGSPTGSTPWTAEMEESMENGGTRPSCGAGVAFSSGAASTQHSGGGKFQHKQTLREEEFEKLWRRHHYEESPQILRTLSICHDGGLHKAAVAQLWLTCQDKIRRIWSSLLMVGFAAANMYYIIDIDVAVLMEKAHEKEAAISGLDVVAVAEANDKDKFLLGKSLWFPIREDVLHQAWLVDGDKLVVFVELTLLGFFLIRLMIHLHRIFFARKECYRWYNVAVLFWQWLPRFSTFSSMKLLHYLTPHVLITETFLEAAFFVERIQGGHYRRAIWKMAWFCMFRLLCLLVGFDAFLVKLRLTARFTNSEDVSLRVVTLGVVFMFQVLGIVNLTIFARKRLFVFIFGGQDGIVNTEEKAKEYLWNALLAKRIYEYFSFFQCVVILISLDDYDFQMLTLKNSNSS